MLCKPLSLAARTQRVQPHNHVGALIIIVGFLGILIIIVIIIIIVL